MKKTIMALLGFLFLAVLLIQGKVFAEQVAPADSSPVASVESANVPETTEESVAGDDEPVDEELKAEEIVDADA